MLKQHEKSSCCRERIRRFGGRRRQCTKCGKTWRVWKKGLGRTAIRGTPELAHRFVRGRLLPLRAPRSGQPQTKHQREYRLARSRRQCAKLCSWPPIPAVGPLIAIGDGLVKQVGRAWHTWYVVLVRHVDSDEAFALPPYHERGTETAAGWARAFAAVGDAVRNRIVALVCDGHRGLVTEARWRGWILQRCHFHLIARIQSRRSRFRIARNKPEAHLIFQHVHRVLCDTDSKKLRESLDLLEEVSWNSTSPEIRQVLQGFVNHFEDFRSYLTHPELRLPVTNNTAEVLIGMIQEACRRAHGFHSAALLDEWARVVIKTRGVVKCTPKNQPN